MLLYSTILHIKNVPVRYEVSWQQENKLLLYKPDLSTSNNSGIPMFYVTKQKGEWLPVNIKDKSIIDQVTKDINAHNIK
jgi:hypothetical protein